MKRYWQRPQYKRYMRRHSAKQNDLRLRFARRKVYERREELRLSRQQRKELRKARALRRSGSIRYYQLPLEPIVAPETFSFVRDANSALHFIKQLEQCLLTKTSVLVDLAQVQELDYGTITVLLSVMRRFKSTGVYFNGRFPKNPGAKLMFLQSGFFTHLDGFFRENDHDLAEERSSILTHRYEKVEGALAARVIALASETIWEERRRCTLAYRVLIELMQNTNEHASLELGSQQLWWLSVKHHSEENRVSFSFVDYGVGIFVNLDQKSPEHRFARLLSKMGFAPNADKLRKIFLEGGRSSTREKYRGKGLPGVYDAFKRNSISNLVLISNDVFFDGPADEYRQLPYPFEGTYVYWELNVDSESLPDALNYR